MVIPRFITSESDFFHIENEYNAVLINGRFSGMQLFKGKGAGGHPTGSAVLSDISASTYQYKYELKKLRYRNDYIFNPTREVELLIRTESNQVDNYIQFRMKNLIPGTDNLFYTRILYNDLLEIQPELIKRGTFIAELTPEIKEIILKETAIPVVK